MGGECMSLIRRRLMLASQSNEPQFQPFPVSPWTLSSTINGEGRDIINDRAAKFGAFCPTYYPAKTGDQILRTKQNIDGDGTTLNLIVHEYKTAQGQLGWLRRTFSLYGNPITLGQDTKYVRFTFAYPSTTGKTMTQEIIDQYFAVSYRGE